MSAAVAKAETIAMDVDDDEEELVDDEQLQEYREMVYNLGSFAVSSFVACVITDCWNLMVWF